MVQMTAMHGHFFAGSCLLADTLREEAVCMDDFRRSSVNARRISVTWNIKSQLERYVVAALTLAKFVSPRPTPIS